jgi:hypothetical protein
VVEGSSCCRSFCVYCVRACSASRGANAGEYLRLGDCGLFEAPELWLSSRAIGGVVLPVMLNFEGDRDSDRRRFRTAVETETSPWRTWVGEGTNIVPPPPLENVMVFLMDA